MCRVWIALNKKKVKANYTETVKHCFETRIEWKSSNHTHTKKRKTRNNIIFNTHSYDVNKHNAESETLDSVFLSVCVCVCSQVCLYCLCEYRVHAHWLQHFFFNFSPTRFLLIYWNSSAVRKISRSNTSQWVRLTRFLAMKRLLTRISTDCSIAPNKQP